MIKKIIIAPETRVRHVGLLDVGEFYTWLNRWFEFEGYWKDTNEKQYIETPLPGGGKKLEFSWECRKDQTGFYTYVISMTFLFIGLNDVEVQNNDKKIKLQKADYDIRMNAYIQKNLKESFFSSFYEKIFLRKRINEYKIDLYGKFYKLVEEMKEFFNVYV
jgi:hypothetical protein